MSDQAEINIEELERVAGAIITDYTNPPENAPEGPGVRSRNRSEEEADARRTIEARLNHARTPCSEISCATLERGHHRAAESTKPLSLNKEWCIE